MIVGVLQARMSSTRLPGKVLADLHGRPMIDRILQRVDRAGSLDDVVVATSTDPSDDALVDHLESAGRRVQRGSLSDVLGRFLAVVDTTRATTVVRLTADNPLIDSDIIDRIVAEHTAVGADYSSNAIVRTFPRGLDAEAVQADALRRLAAMAPTDSEREHVTLGVYRRPGTFRLHEVVQEPDRSELRWTVDVPADLEFARAVYAEFDDPEARFGQDQVLSLLDRRPDLTRREADLG